MAEVFYKGDKVAYTGDDCEEISNGDEVWVVRTDSDTLYFSCDPDELDDETCGHPINDFEIMERKMSDVKTVLKNTKLTADDRLLRLEALEDSNGVMTGTGQAVMLERMWAEQRSEIAKEIRAARAQEKAELEAESKS